MRKYQLLMLLAASLAMPSLQAIAKSAADYFEEAIVRFDGGEYRASVILLKNALRSDPAHLPSRILLGKSLLHLGDVAAAEKDLKIARNYGADESQVVTLIGSTYLVQGKYQQLLAEIRSGGRADEVEMQILVLRAYAHLQLGDLEQAKKNLRRARRLQPDNAGPMLALATVAIREGALDEARRLIDMAERHNPEAAEMLFARGELARLRGDTDRAVELLGESLALNPGKVQARMSRAALLMKQGDDASARTDVDAVLANSPRNLQAIYLDAMLLARAGEYKRASTELQEISQTLSGVDTRFLNSHGPTILLMGTLHYLQNDLERAKSRLKRYINLEPNHLQPRLLLADTLLKMDDSVGAILALKPMLEQYPEEADLLLLAGTAYLRDKRYDEASSFLERAARLKPDLADIRTRLALSNLGQGDTRKAMNDLSQAVEMDGNNIGAGVLLVNMQLRESRYEEALATVAKIRSSSPDNPLLLNLAGLAWLGKNAPEEAQAAFTAALRAAPDFPPAQLNLAALEAGLQNFAAAGEHYNAILRKRPEDVRAMEGLAKIAELQSRREEAITWLEKIRNLESIAASESVLGRLAELYLAEGKAQQALLVADELGKRRPGELTELDLKGRAHLLLGEREKAARFFRIMQQSEPGSAATLQRIAALLMQAGDLQSAATAIEQALAKDPTLLPALGTRIVINQRLGRVDDALAQAAKLQRSHPDIALGAQLRGDILMQKGEYRAAAVAYDAALGIEPQSQLLLLQARAERAAGEPQQAIALLQHWLQHHPDDLKVHEVLAAVFNRQGAFEQARGHYEAVTRLQPEEAGAFNNLAVLYQRIDHPDAVATARKAYQLDPNDAAVNDTLGWLLVQQGEPQQGLDFLRQAQARATRNPEVRYHLAVALHRLGRSQESVRELRAALAQPEGFGSLAEAQALLHEIGAN
ncbi:MAG: PEP-CTERM system TPR-repeat protein PrsT [Gammaproteobacteria bacterium]|nr:PEP-CTERM system TPR-repeat protein PrsT [Gammaproteobacteria bacterium]